MKVFPKIICSSVVRSSQQGDSHGGLYLVDLDKMSFEQVVDWNEEQIDWEGMGGERGLRGIAFYNQKIICATSSQLLFFDQEFNLLNIYTNKYLSGCHEICVEANTLFITSTDFDSILEFDLQTNKFISAYFYRSKPSNSTSLASWLMTKFKIDIRQFDYAIYDLNKEEGPSKSDTNHINNVFVSDGAIYFSGTNLCHVMKIRKDKKLERWKKIPLGTHNVTQKNGGLIYNDTNCDRIVVAEQITNGSFTLDMVKFDGAMLDFANIPSDHARPMFARGLCFYEDLMIGGSSPSTLSVYSLKEQSLLRKINLTMDVRNAIHGLEIYPY